MEVEREPLDVGVELAPGLLGRDLAEPAERSDVVAPDDDRVLGLHDTIIASLASSPGLLLLTSNRSSCAT